MIGTPPSKRHIPVDAMIHAWQFANEYADKLCRRDGPCGAGRDEMYSAGDGREDAVIHNPTAGFFDQNGTVSKPLDMRIVRRLLDELGEVDTAGVLTLGGWTVRFDDGCVILP